MKRSVAFLAALFAVACSDRSPTAVPTRPNLEINDATHGAGNPDFFFLPPMVPNPSTDPRFDAGAFNPNLSPVVEVCRWDDPGTCGAVVAYFTTTSGLGSETIRVNTTDQHYIVNWHTDLSNLDPALTYRIRVSVGEKELGFADVDVVSTGSQLRNVQTGEYIGLVDGRTLPIKFRIENGALCDPPGTSPCGSGTVDLASGGNVVVPGTGDRIDIPAQTGGGPVVTITIQYCDGINVDVPTFGPCLSITSDPPDLSFSPRATVSVCSLPVPQLTDEQKGLVTLYRQHGDELMALPHATDHCETTVGAAPAPPRNLADAGWRLLRRAVGALLRAPRLYATAPVLHLGAGGETPAESNFQFGLPALMAPLPNTQGQTAPPGDTVPYPPGVIVTDTSGAPVAGATIHFQITQGNGTVVPESVITDTLGIAMVSNWRLGDPGANQLRAWAIGISSTDSFPIVPDTLPLAADTGQVLFNATAGTGGPSGWVLYGVNGEDDGLSRIDVATGAVTFIGRLNPDLTKWTTPVAMSTRLRDSTLFVWNNSDQVTTGVLLTVDRCTGQGVRVDSTTPNQGPLQSLAMSPTDTLYGLETELYRINTTTGVKSVIGSLGLPGGGRAFGADFFGSTLYGVSDGGTLFTVNTSSGAATAIGTLTPSVGTPGSLVADPATGKLIGSAFGGTAGNVIFDINPATGAVSNIRTLAGGFAPQGMGFGPPCSAPPPVPVDTVGSVSVTPEGATGSGGLATAFTATVRSTHGDIMSEVDVTWSSLNPHVATINSSSGVATGVGAGQAVIKAEVHGVAGYALLTVQTPGLAGVNLWAAEATPGTDVLRGVWGTSIDDVWAVGWDGAVYHRTATGWNDVSIPTTTKLWGVGGVAANQVWAVGDAGTIFYYNGDGWTSQASGVFSQLQAVWGSSPSNVWAVGSGGTILHYDGSLWTSTTSPTTNTLVDIWGTARDDIWAVGAMLTILHYDGSTWTEVESSTSNFARFNAVWGLGPTNVWVRGDGNSSHYDGASWSAVSIGPGNVYGDASIEGMWGTAADDVWALGPPTRIQHFDGAAWSELQGPNPGWLFDVTGTPDGTVFAVGQNGVILRSYRSGSVIVTPSSSQLTGLGATQQLTATARDASSNVIGGLNNGDYAWSSSDAGVATVDANGLVTAAGNGAATITATAAGGATGSATVTVDIGLSATSDGTVQDGFTSPKDGNPDAVLLNSVVQVLNVDRPSQPFEDRGIIEFSLAGVAGPISTVELDLSRFGSTGPYPFTVGLYGYAGDGMVTLSDFAAGSLLSSFQYAGESTVQLDVTSFVQGLRADGAAYAGFNLRFTVPTTIEMNGPFVAFNSLEYPPAARLLIQ